MSFSINYIFRNLYCFVACAALAGLIGCAAGQVEETGAGASPPTNASTGGGGNNAGGNNAGGMGGMSLCAQDCSAIGAPQCLKSVCNDGTYQGSVGQCVVVPEDMGEPCDDDTFCTIEDACDGAGQCVGGPANDCGMTADVCMVVTCVEASQTCMQEPGMNGTMCQDPTNLCIKGSTCSNGLCIGGALDDCFFFPVPDDCHMAECNPTNGMCEPVIDPGQEGQPCVFGGDPCMVDKICTMGNCVGGNPKDCSSLDMGCFNGVCDATNGNCIQMSVPQGMVCNDGSDQCNVGICDNMTNCIPNPVVDGTLCDDFNTCTANDVCTTGICAGIVDPQCTLYFEENFEAGCPPAGWVFQPEWECGTPTVVGPSACSEGVNCIGTDLDSNYENNMAYNASYAQTPPIGLGLSGSPFMVYRHWVDTEGSVYDGYNLKISTDGGTTFSVIPLANVDPPYNLTIASEPAWGGHQGGAGWQIVTADLTPWTGQNVIIRYSFHSDASIVYPGIYIDDIVVGELIITTASLPNGFVGSPYSASLEYVGASTNVTWSITGGTNHSWLTINPSTGVLTGTPAMSNAGPVSITVRVTDNATMTYSEETYNFSVQQAVYVETFDAGCPGGWTLNNWQCGAPMTGPNAAYSGTNVIALVLMGQYANNLGYATTTATSPAINLASTTAPQLHFFVWFQTELNFDGFNLKVSNDGGLTYNIVTAVTPIYNQTLASEQCWAGTSPGYQEYTADLTAFAGQTINLRFAFRSDGSITYPGVFIDDVVVAD